jgi:hypothetical protein
MLYNVGQMKPKDEKLTVDLADPRDIRDKLPEARRILAMKREAATRAQDEVRGWERLVENLATIATPTEATLNGQGRLQETVREMALTVTPVKPPKRRHASPRQDAVVTIINASSAPMKAAGVAVAMGEPENVNSINAALWAAARAGRIEKVGRSLYARLETAEAAM